ncbi:MAG: ABC transporter permease [Alphaproteobacteria bacterium]|nr:ABC transporter permease [Alphaproteobacteria bacterium]MDE2494042.1 ABC transporter permease [Alphaproteobacteria bacterium]
MAVIDSATMQAPLRKQVFDLLIRLRATVALLFVIVFFSVMAPNFLSAANFFIMFKHVAIIAILAIGMTFVILTGGIDLSVGSIVGLAGMAAGGLIVNGIVLPWLGIVIYPSVYSVVALALLLGALVGWVNGLLITRFGVAPFIATLGLLYIARGAAMLLSNGATFPNLVGNPTLGNQGFPWLGAGTIAGIPVPVVILAGLSLIAWFIASRTVFGRHVYAIGGNERAAFLSGIRVNHVKIIVYMISGICAALVGVLIASELVAAHPASGESFELGAIAAVVLGGASLAGGRGTIGGSIIGACVIAILSDGMVMMGISEFWQMVIKGAVIVAAVMLDRLQSRLSEGIRE